MTRKSVKFKNLNGEVVGMLLQMSGLRSCLAWSLKFQGDFQEVQHCFPICIQHPVAAKAKDRKYT